MKANKTCVLTHATVLSGLSDMVPRENCSVTITDGVLTDIREGAPASAHGKTVDLGGQFLMPGLINMHVHLPAGGKPRKKPSDPKKLVRLITSNALFNRLGVAICESAAKCELKSGVTTIRTVGGVSDYDTRIRDRIRQGKVLGPRILASDMAISVPGGHMAGSLAYEAHTPEEAADLVDRIAQTKPDLIKLMITGGVLDAEVVGEPGVLRMKPDMVRAACQRAHALGLRVAAHVESTEGVRVALENGVDSIEHGARPTPEIMDAYRQHGAFHILTISPALPFALFDSSVSHTTPEQRENGKIVFDGVVAMANACLAAGVPVGLGTDTGCPFVTHYDMWRELCYFVKYCGVTPEFALHTATLVNARLAGIDDLVGSVEVGKRADLIVCAENPLKDLSALRNLSYVIRDGVLIPHPHVRKMRQVEKHLDPYL